MTQHPAYGIWTESVEAIFSRTIAMGCWKGFRHLYLKEVSLTKGYFVNQTLFWPTSFIPGKRVFPDYHSPHQVNQGVMNRGMAIRQWVWWSRVTYQKKKYPLLIPVVIRWFPSCPCWGTCLPCFSWYSYSYTATQAAGTNADRRALHKETSGGQRSRWGGV